VSDALEPFSIFSVVEGHGELESVEILIRKIANAGSCQRAFLCLKPMRVRRDLFLKCDAEGEFGKKLQVAAKHIRGKEGLILILLDAEEDCPAELADRIRSGAAPLIGDVQLSVVLAKRMFENWLAASAHTLTKNERFRKELTAPEKPEEISGKTWIKRSLLPYVAYSEPVDQPAFTRLLDPEAASRCRSFRKLTKEIQSALSQTP